MYIFMYIYIYLYIYNTTATRSLALAAGRLKDDRTQAHKYTRARIS